MASRSRLFPVLATFSLVATIALSLVSAAPPLSALAQQGADTIEPRGPRGGPPQGLTAELVVGGTRYLFDRVVPIRRQDLVRIAAAEPVIVYAREEEPPFAAVYASVPPREQASIARYLPENAASPEEPCRAEDVILGSLDAGEAGVFAFAGFESDLTPGDLQDSGATPDGFTAYVGTEQPLAEIFVDAPEGLQRFVHLDDQGLPAVLAGNVAFAGQSYAFSGPAAEGVDGLPRIGCAGAFPLYGAPVDGQPVADAIAVVGGQPLRFAPTGEDAESTVVESELPGAGGPPEDAVDGDDPAPAEDPSGTPAAEDPSGDPEEATATDAPCPAETGDIGIIDGGESGQFVFAGVEPDLTADTLQQIATTPDNRAVYAESTDSFSELFVAGDDGLLRYVVLDERGLPAAIGDEFPFGDQAFIFVEESTDVDRAALSRAGCAGSFPVLAEAGTDGEPFADLYLAVADRLFLFQASDDATDAAQPPTATTTATPTETSPASPVPTAAAEATATTTAPPPIVARDETATAAPAATASPTATASPVPTEVPTATPEPEPTSTAAPTATAVPTATPTPEPTATAAPEPTAVPTATPMPPTSTAAPAATVLPTATDPVTATAEPAPSTPAPDPTTAAAETAADPAATEPAVAVQPSPTPDEAEAPPGEADEAEAETTQATESTDALPPQLEVRNTTYDLVPAEGRVDTRGLVEVNVLVVQNQTVTIYAEQNNQLTVSPLFATVAGGRLVGRYVPAAVAAPAPPPSLPANVEVGGATYVFNEVETNVNIQNLVQVEVVQVQNIAVTVYAEQNVLGRPVRLYGVADDGQVVGQYIETTVVQQAERTRRPRPFRSAVAVTPPTSAQPAAASTAVSRPNACSGEIAPLDDDGVPRNLPTRIQIQGVSYSFVGGEKGAVGTLTRIGCVGSFEAVSSDAVDAAEVIYLRVPGTAEGQGVVYRFEAIVTVDVELQVTGRPQTITLRPVADQPATNYSVRATWSRSIYSSTTVILYAEDPANPTPPLIYAYDVDDDVVGEYAPEGEIQEASPELQAAAEANGLNPDLVLDGLQRYILVAIWVPTGSTADGWVTFYSADPGGRTETLLGRDPRQPELLVYQRSG